MGKPDFDWRADGVADANGVVYVTKEVFAQTLREAYFSGLERAAEIAEDGLGRTITSIAASIRAEKELSE